MSLMARRGHAWMLTKKGIVSTAPRIRREAWQRRVAAATAAEGFCEVHENPEILPKANVTKLNNPN
jgi:hypothetical protein